ncbi:hypothetical protein K438DRAFT_1775129 [Mycena galopus ATCC 62051]|nr:hypothetical protein K438DRAFT_1775129 [Mycena galopus ATCC 62051]
MSRVERHRDTTSTVEPSQDGDYLFDLAWDPNFVAGLPVGSSQLGENGDMDCAIADSELDFVPSSQPTQDGEESFLVRPSSANVSVLDAPSLVHITCQYWGSRSFVDPAVKFRAQTGPFREHSATYFPSETEPSVESRQRQHAPQPEASQARNKGPERTGQAMELDRKRERARQRAQRRAQRIEMEIRTLAKTTARLRREHKRLSHWLVTDSENKENSFWA